MNKDGESSSHPPTPTSTYLPTTSVLTWEKERSNDSQKTNGKWQ